MMTIPPVLAAAGIIVAACLLLLAFPVIRCPRCNSKRVLRKRNWRGRRRARKCPVCRGAGHIVPPGATLVHRSFWAIAGERIKERRRDENAERLVGRNGDAA